MAKLCPMRKRLKQVPIHGAAVETFETCAEAECAWFHQRSGQCAVLVIAGSISAAEGDGR